MTRLTRFDFRGVAGLVAAVLLAAPAGADDARIRERIEARLQKDGLDRVGDIRVTVEDGTATLEGGVLTLDAYRRAGKAAAKATKKVVNDLRVLPEPRPDADLRKDVADVILRYTGYTVFDSVELGVDKGVVRLGGSVREPYNKQEIEDRVARTPGVREILNDIRVQPVSLFDDQLRRQLYRAIYRNGHFVQYAIQAIPPIRIVVENGKVTLDGYVSSRVEQALLGSIARSSLAFSVDNRVKVDGESPDERVPSRS